MRAKLPGLAALQAAVLVFAVYLSMLPQIYTDANFGMDGGDLLGAVLTDGIPHPSGYPTYLLLGKIFQLLPWGTPYFKGALLSAVFASAAAGLTGLLAERIISDSVPYKARSAITGGVGLLAGFSPLLWSQAVIVEVYALAVFFILCGLWWMYFLLSETDGRKWRLIFPLSALVGLGFGNHLMLGMLAPGFLYAFICSFREKHDRKNLIICALIGIVSALLPYTILPLRSAAGPPINWGDPQTWDGFFWLVSGRLYQGLSFRIPIRELLARITYFFTLLREHFGIGGLLLGVYGAVQFSSSEWRFRWVLLYTFFIFPLFSIGYTTNDSVVYTIPAFIVFALWIGYGISEIWPSLASRPKWQAATVAGLLFLLLIIQLPGLYADLDPRSELQASQFAGNCLAALPEESILFTDADADTFPIWYYHFGLGKRADIKVITTQLLQFDWYRRTLVETYPVLSALVSDGQTTGFDLTSVEGRYPVCRTNYPAGTCDCD